MTFVNTLHSAVQKRIAFMRTKNELRNMPLEVAIDLGLFREDAAKTANKVIYG